jgi:hypothetical protein
MRMLVSRRPVSHLDPVFPFREALSNHGACADGDPVATSVSGLAVSVDADQALDGSVVRAISESVAGASALQGLSAFGLVSTKVCSARKSGFSVKAASFGEYVQPAPRGSSLVASFRLLQTSPRNGMAMSSGAQVPSPGPSGGTSWRL